MLIRLIGEAQERGARTLADLHGLAAPRTRRVYGKRSLAHGAPSRPGVYRFEDRNGLVLYVGRARDLRARLRSYFRSDRQRPSVEAALGAVERIEWQVLGSELEAGLEELRLIRELRPPANARNVRPDRYLYLRRRGDRWSSGPCRESSGLSAAAGAPSAPHGRWTARRSRSSRCSSAAGLSPASAAAWPLSPPTCATRTRRGSATASLRSKR